MTERAETATVRLAPLAATVVAILWVGAIGFRAGWWSTGRIDLGWNALTLSLATPSLQTAARVFAIIGTGVPALIEAALLVLVVLRRRGAFWAASTAVICGAGSLDVSAMKAVAGRLRPDSAYGWQNSFPSGHTAFAALLMTLTALLVLRGRWRLLALPYPIAMAWSRTQLHAHWLSDVLAGALLGAATAVLLLLLAEAVRRRPASRRGDRAARPRGGPAEQPVRPDSSSRAPRTTGGASIEACCRGV